jgi:hypothetical protein
MSHESRRRASTMVLGVAAAAFAAAGLAATAPFAYADDIDMYGGQDVSTFTQFLGTGGANVFTITTNYFTTVDETTGVVTPHFSLPTVVESHDPLMPGFVNEGGFSFIDSNTQYFGDLTNLTDTTSADTDFFTAAGGDVSNFLPLQIENFFSPPIVDADPFPF